MSKKVECGPGCDPNTSIPLPQPHAPVSPCCEATATGIDCNGNPVSATGVGVVQTIPHPDAVQRVEICNPPKDFQSQVLCLPDGEQVISVTTVDPNTGIPSTNYYNFDGTPFTGDPSELFRCPEGGSLVPQVMCDEGSTNFIRWYITSDDEVSGSFDTNLVGLPYTPTGSVTLGACGTSEPFINPVHWIENITSSPSCVEGKAVYGYNPATGGFSIIGLYTLTGLPVLPWPDTLMEGPCPGLPFYLEVAHWDDEVLGCQEGLALYITNPISQTGEVVYMGLFHRTKGTRIEPEPLEFAYGPCPIECAVRPPRGLLTTWG